jgi:hypothetical protein
MSQAQATVGTACRLSENKGYTNASPIEFPSLFGYNEQVTTLLQLCKILLSWVKRWSLVVSPILPKLV